MEYRLLGSLEVLDGTSPVDLGGAKQRALLANLLLHANQVVPTDVLVDELWSGDPPPSAVITLQGYISNLRRALEPGRRRGEDSLLVTQTPGYRLRVEPDSLDVTRFEGLTTSGRNALAARQWHAASSAFREALGLWRGVPLADFSGESFAMSAATRLQELRIAAFACWVDSELAQGRHAEIVAELEAVANGEPLREDLHRQLMVALYRSGRQADALAVFQRLRATLLDELGIDPRRELVELERAILLQDPALDLAEAQPPAVSGDDSPLLRAPANLARTPMVGRARELAAMSQDVAAAMSGSGRVVALSGEPGIGKTRLCEEVADLAREAGADVVWGRCYEGTGAPAFWPWTEALRAILEGGDAAVTGAALGRGASAVAHILPEVHDLIADLDPAPMLDADSARFRVSEAVAAFVRQMCAHRPLLLVLEDLHWADVASLQLLTFLCRTVDSSALLIIATHRDVDPTISDALSAALADLARIPAARRLPLAGLDEAEVAQFVAESVASDPNAAMVATLCRRTRGNPFFLTELLRLLGDQELHDSTDFSTAVPIGVRHTIRRRVGDLPRVTSEAINMASVLGQKFELAVLARALDLDGASLLDALEPAIDTGLVGPIPAVPGRYGFAHALVNETLLSELPPAGRARLHLRAAEALQASHGDQDGPHLVTLAVHWCSAVPAATAIAAVEHCLTAADWAQRHLAHEQAEDLLRSALSLLDTAANSPQRAALEYRVLEQMSRLLIMTTGYASEGLSTTCDRMRVLCTDLGDPRLVMTALWRLSVYYCVRMQLDIGISLGEQLIELGDMESLPEALLAGHMILGAAYSHRAELVISRHHLDRSLELCRAGHDIALDGVVVESASVWTCSFSAWNWCLLGEHDRAESDTARALQHAQRNGDMSYGMVFAVWFSGLVAFLRRDRATTLQRAETGLALAKKTGFVMMVPFITVNRGWALIDSGDVEAGIAEVTAGATIARASGAGMLRHVFVALLAEADLKAGRAAAALAFAEEGLNEVESTTERWYEAELHRLRGLAHQDLGDATAAASAYQSAIEVATAQQALSQLARARRSLDDLVRDNAAGQP